MSSTSLMNSTFTTAPPLPVTTLMPSMALCTTTWLPANGIISLSGQNDDAILTLDNDARFIAPCPTASIPTVSVDVSTPESSLSLQDLGDGDDDSPHFSDFRDPFYASSFPILYALASTTVMSWMLVLMLFITPRSFFDSGVVYLGRPGGFRNSSSGGINIGGRPWLQKLAALTVAISLTIATADTFKIAKIQYIWGVQNAKVLQNEVMGSTELKAIRIVSDTFLWLAQAQTLIRLFPRHRERIIIRWAACALISLDVIFSGLNSFLYADPDTNGNSMPQSFAHPIPALSYLFQLALGVLYAAWVIYYSFMKKRYAFYHPLMKNICLVAILSLGAILMPVVFFILDISKPEFTGWGDYVRWVGAAAASVIVWEWVERIEALEREEKKDGILGREVFDGDDTLEDNAAGVSWSRKHPSRKGDGGNFLVRERQRTFGGVNAWPTVTEISARRRRHHTRDQSPPSRRRDNEEQAERTTGPMLRQPHWLARPPPVATPVSRTDTASADSTDYAVRYQGGSDFTARTPDLPHHSQDIADVAIQGTVSRSNSTIEDAAPSVPASRSVAQNGHIVIQEPRRSIDLEANATESNDQHWRALFHRNGENTLETAPSDVQSTSTQRLRAGSSRSNSRWDVRSRLEEFAANQAERIREKIRPTLDTDNLPVTVIPAPPRRGTALQQVLEEEESGGSPLAYRRRNAQRSSGDSSDEDLYGDGATQHDRQQSNHNYNNHHTYTSATASTFPHERPIPPSNPPLWPGVRNRQQVYEDDAYSYDESLMETSSVVSHDLERDPEPGNVGSDDRQGSPRTAGT